MTANMQKALVRAIGIMIMTTAALLLVVLMGGSDEVSGKTWYVDDSGGADFEKIQDAINTADAGDTVRVFEGLYRENVHLRQRIDLIVK